MADAYVVFGYSEGGYGAVPIADALYRMNKTIIALHAGGGPYRLSSVELKFAVEDIMGGSVESLLHMALLGASLSSTTTDVANFGQGQDFFRDDTIRDAIVHASQTIDLHEGKRDAINSIITWDNPLSFYNPDLVDVYAGGIARGEPEPCVTSVTEKTDKLCQALRDQDVIDILELASYPVFLCHSVEDQLVPFANLPDPDVNRNVRIRKVKGRHAPAGIPCVIQFL